MPVRVGYTFISASMISDSITVVPVRVGYTFISVSMISDSITAVPVREGYTFISVPMISDSITVVPVRVGYTFISATKLIGTEHHRLESDTLPIELIAQLVECQTHDQEVACSNPNIDVLLCPCTRCFMFIA